MIVNGGHMSLFGQDTLVFVVGKEEVNLLAKIYRFVFGNSLF